MPTCFLKRVLPFVIALLLGLALGSFATHGETSRHSCGGKALRAFASFQQANGADQNKIYSSNEVTRKVRIISKPQPDLTEEARSNHVSGTVVLSAVFAASGEVTNIDVVRGLPSELTEKAIAAARQIKFQPAEKDGQPVSMLYKLEYSFLL